MEFLVTLTPHLPESLIADQRTELFKEERARGSAFLAEGKMRRMWRLPDTTSALLFSNITEGLPDHGCGGDALGELMGGNWMRIVETCSGLSIGPPHCVARIAGEET
jgi:muconolactone delta-isomerase